MEADKNLKCLTINESKDVVDYGISSQTFTFKLSEKCFKKCEEYRFNNNFILHFYISDSFDKEITIGVDRYDKCSVVEYNENKKIIKIKGFNKEFYNLSRVKLLRKDKIGNFLIDFKDDDINDVDI